MYEKITRLTTLASGSLLIMTLSGCQTALNFDSVDSVKTLTKQIQNADNIDDVKAIAKQAKVSRDLIRADLKAIQALYKNLDQKVNKKWGKDNSQLPDKKKYVKYVNDYQARAIVDFDKGKVRVETVNSRAPKNALIEAVKTTLLTTADPTKTDIFSSSAPNTDGVPFLYPQVLDNEGVLVKYPWRAGRYADYLVSNKLQKNTASGKTIYAVEFDLVEKHEHLRQEKYSKYVIAAANRYKLEPALIYGIIETESSFNPYAVSPANAYGLMQVVPATAGKDVYNLVKKKSGQPSKDVLFSPEQNIDIGSAYLHILQTRYLVKVSNKTSQEYSMISAYNGGTGNVLKTFDSNRTTAMNKINQTSASQVYQLLRYKHPRAESRKYLEKVTKAKKNYE
ncbi:Lytic transglycosylase catalytic [Marinomonas posidonica IVIA-Po-181]|uniref:Lytic transglycosylase catalytic n=2 Tax=Marinomonas TaxID=28253 RepID=F6CWQ3_MARPP|nr:Lytic transglycosylase catalytic [Marinomonas posidonica IVIA-Po-181]